MSSYAPALKHYRCSLCWAEIGARTCGAGVLLNDLACTPSCRGTLSGAAVSCSSGVTSGSFSCACSGSKTFLAQTVPTTVAGWQNGARDVHAADLDGDGDKDLLAAYSSSAMVTWWANDGSGSFGQLQAATQPRFFFSLT